MNKILWALCGFGYLGLVCYCNLDWSNFWTALGGMYVVCLVGILAGVRELRQIAENEAVS